MSEALAAIVDFARGQQYRIVYSSWDGGAIQRFPTPAHDWIAARLRGRAEAAAFPARSEAEPDALTASFSAVPSSHDGESEFSFELRFSEAPEVSYQTLRDNAFNVANGTIRRAARVTSGDNQRWTITVEPASDDDVRIQLEGTSGCDDSNAICTGDGRRLENSPSATVAGPEGETPATNTPATGAPRISGTAQVGKQLTASVSNIDDEGSETLTLTLSNPSGARIVDGDASGTIKNRDPLPRALLARFGRTAAVHVVDNVEQRLAAARTPGLRARFAGRELRRGAERDLAVSFLSQLGGLSGHGPLGGPAADAGRVGWALGPQGMARGMLDTGSGAGPHAGGLGRPAGPPGPGAQGPGGMSRMGMGLGRDLLNGAGFTLDRESRGGVLSLWSRGARAHFAGREGTLGLSGDVRTTLLGADYARGPAVAGLSLSHSRGLGEYAGASAGQVLSSVTGLYPWVDYRAGYAVRPVETGGVRLEVGVDAQMRESALYGGTDKGVVARAGIGW